MDEQSYQDLAAAGGIAEDAAYADAARCRVSDGPLRADVGVHPMPPAIPTTDYLAPMEPDGGGPECWPPMSVMSRKGRA